MIQIFTQYFGFNYDLLKYLAANMGLIHTKINDILQDMHLIRHEETTTVVNWSSTKI